MTLGERLNNDLRPNRRNHADDNQSEASEMKHNTMYRGGETAIIILWTIATFVAFWVGTEPAEVTRPGPWSLWLWLQEVATVVGPMLNG